MFPILKVKKYCFYILPHQKNLWGNTIKQNPSLQILPLNQKCQLMFTGGLELKGFSGNLSMEGGCELKTITGFLFPNALEVFI